MSCLQPRAMRPADLWVRPTDSFDARELPGTLGGNGPFWSPDGKSIGFMADAKLKRIDVAGGAPQLLCDAQGFQGATWAAPMARSYSAPAAGSKESWRRAVYPLLWPLPILRAGQPSISSPPFS